MALGITNLLAVSRVEHGIISVPGNPMAHVVSMLVRIITVKNRHMIPEDIFTSHNGQLMGVHQVSDMGLLTHTMVIASLSWITTGIERPMMVR